MKRYLAIGGTLLMAAAPALAQYYPYAPMYGPAYGPAPMIPTPPPMPPVQYVPAMPMMLPAQPAAVVPAPQAVPVAKAVPVASAPRAAAKAPAEPVLCIGHSDKETASSSLQHADLSAPVPGHQGDHAPAKSRSWLGNLMAQAKDDAPKEPVEKAPAPKVDAPPAVAGTYLDAPANGSARCGWRLNLQPMMINVYGYDDRIGDVVHDLFTPTANDGFQENQTRTAIEFDLSTQISLRTELEYRAGNWGAGVSGWWMNADDKINGRVESLPFDGTTFSTNFTLMFSDGRGPVVDVSNPSGFAPENFFGKEKLQTWTTDVYGLYTLADGSVGWIDLVFGLKAGGVKTKQDRGLLTTAFDDDDGLLFLNDISLVSNARSNFNGVGPLLGLAGEAQVGRFHFRSLFNQSLVIGRATQRGLFVDTDNILIDDIFGPAFLQSRIGYTEAQTAYVPVTETMLMVSYEPFSWMTIGIGGFVSIWWNVPVAPKWEMPTVGAQFPATDIEFVGQWERNERTLRYVGLLLEMGMRF